MSLLDCNAKIVSELLALDRQRDELRAEMEDLDTEYPASSLEAATDYGMTLQVAEERWRKRQSRRAWERKHNIPLIKPGPWSQDLDDYHDDNGYAFDLGDGYSGRLVRNGYATFAGYIQLPEGHPCLGIRFNNLSRPSWTRAPKTERAFPEPPVELTSDSQDVFGYNSAGPHTAVSPLGCVYRFYKEYPYYSKDLPFDNQIYVDFGSAVKQLKMMGEYFKTLERDYWVEIVKWRTTIQIPIDNPTPFLKRRRELVKKQRIPAFTAWLAAQKERMGL